MLVLLPPSETKQDGGDGPPLLLGTLSYPTLGPLRAALLDELVALAADEPARARALLTDLLQQSPRFSALYAPRAERALRSLG